MNHNKGNKFCTISSGRKGVYGELQPFDTFFPLTEGIFENKKVMLPGKYDRYLTNLYGNYMKIPQENERVTLHKILKFNLSKQITI